MTTERCWYILPSCLRAQIMRFVNDAAQQHVFERRPSLLCTIVTQLGDSNTPTTITQLQNETSNVSENFQEGWVRDLLVVKMHFGLSEMTQGDINKTDVMRQTFSFNRILLDRLICNNSNGDSELLFSDFIPSGCHSRSLGCKKHLSPLFGIIFGTDGQTCWGRK